MRTFSRVESWLRDAEDYEISDIMKSEFNIYAPTISRKLTKRGSEYIVVEGLKIQPGGLSERVVLNLSYCGPVCFRVDGQMMLDLDYINSNLLACKKYIHYLDDVNCGREIDGVPYKEAVKTVYDHINACLKKQKNSLPSEME